MKNHSFRNGNGFVQSKIYTYDYYYYKTNCDCDSCIS